MAYLEINGTGFWISGELTVLLLTDNVVRMILTVADPDTLITQALKAGAKMISAIREEY